MTARDDPGLGSVMLPPHSVEAEQAVLGGLMVNNAAWDRIGDVVCEADFYRADHRLVWRSIAKLIGENKPADVLTVTDALKRDQKLQDVGGMTYLHQLASGTPGAANIRAYAGVVRERAQRRALIAAATEILDAAYAPKGDPLETINDRAQSLIMHATTRGSESGGRGMAQLLSRVMQNLDDRHRGGTAKRMPTGLIDLDKMLHGGLLAGRLYFIAGRPGMGKSALGLQIALSLAEQGFPGFVSSMEMLDEENAERALAGTALVPLDNLITGELGQEHWDRLGVALGKLNDLPIVIDDTPSLTLNRLRAKVRAQRIKYGALQWVLVDYLQLMKADERRERNDLEVGEIAQGLKALAKELDVAVIALSAVNRKCEERPNKRPLMSDLSQSGGLDAAADFIGFVYRDDVYDPNSEDRGIAELVVRKIRQGKLDILRFTFRGEFSRFENYAGTWAPRAPKSPPKRGFNTKDD